jgi:hypothetical protein
VRFARDVDTGLHGTAFPRLRDDAPARIYRVCKDENDYSHVEGEATD